MGYNTPVFILNDGMDQLEKHPNDFVEGILRRLVGGGSFGVGNHANVVDVKDSQHASVFRLYGSHGNLMVDLSHWSRETEALARRNPEQVRSYNDRARASLNDLEAAVGKWEADEV